MTANQGYVFSIIAAHELNHVVDAFTILGSEALSQRKATLS